MTASTVMALLTTWRPAMKLAVAASFDGLEDEGPGVRDHARLEERVPDIFRRVAVLDLKDYGARIRRVHRRRKTRAQVAADDVGHEGDLQGRWILRPPLGNAMEEGRAGQEVTARQAPGWLALP